MKKAFGYIVWVLAVVIYAVSSSTELTESIALRKSESNSIFRSDKFRYGDLYGMTYLSQFQIPKSNQYTVPLIPCNAKRNTRLYAICDSYIYAFAHNKSFYCGIDSLLTVRIAHEEKLDGKLDTQKDNIFLLEVVERSLRTILTDTSYLGSLIDKQGDKKVEKSRMLTVFSGLSEFLFNKSINTNLEMNIWDFPIFTGIKEFKADLNYKLFNSVDKNVDISPDKKYLLYKSTIDTGSITSSFQFIPDSELFLLVESLNHFYMHAKSLGFKDVYLSIIPNPVSVLYPDYKGYRYNGLIPRIQNSPDLKMKIVDIYSAFKNAKEPVYYLTGTHWNFNGSNMWLNKFNSMLMEQTTNR